MFICRIETDFQLALSGQLKTLRFKDLANKQAKALSKSSNVFHCLIFHLLIALYVS